MTIGLSELIAAAIGAIATGAFQILTNHLEKRKRAEVVLTAISSEVDAICRIITTQGYQETIGKIASDVQRGMWNGQIYIIDIRSNYFAVFEGLVSDLGLLKPIQACKIVNFYVYCKSVIDSTRPDGPHALDPSTPEAAQNMVQVALLLHSIVNLGNEITQFPKLPIVHADDSGSEELPQ